MALDDEGQRLFSRLEKDLIEVCDDHQMARELFGDAALAAHQAWARGQEPSAT